jgi:SAM-dependent methyltransferase
MTRPNVRREPLGRFNTDTGALQRRERLNSTLAAHDLEEWIVERAQPKSGERVLDIGCGTGKQIFYLAQRTADLDILGVDISEEAVATVRRRARHIGTTGVAVERIGIDECVDRLAPATFDLILSTYAIYYSRDLERAVQGLAQLLRPGGRVFMSGPGAGTNRELIAIVRAIANDDAVLADINDFIAANQLETARQYWGAIEIHRLDNEIAFPSAEAVLEWWRAHNSYRPEFEEGVAAALTSVVAREGRFRLTKNVLGLLLRHQ